MSDVATNPTNPLIPSNLADAFKLAEMMSRGKLVPKHLQGQPGDCLMVIEQAMRWGMSPFAVAQCTSVIQQKLMFEGKLVAAAMNASTVLASRLTMKFAGAGSARSITLTGTLRGETEPRDITVTLAEARTSNEMWTRQPDQQLVYFATRAWARRHCPEVMLGVYSPEEFPVQAANTTHGTTIDVSADPVQQVAPAVQDAAVAPSTPPARQTTGQWLDALDARLHGAITHDEVANVCGEMKVGKMAAWLEGKSAAATLDAILAAADTRVRDHESDMADEWNPPGVDPELDEMLERPVTPRADDFPGAGRD